MGQMNEFLRVVDGKDECNPDQKEWIGQLREIAYDVEDVLDNMDQGSSSTLPKNECYDGRGDALFLDDNDVVGIEGPKEQLLEWIHSMDDGLEVISVVQPKQDKIIEEVAIEYLNDLYNRSLIQVAERHIDGRVRAFRIHDLLRDYIVPKSGEHNIVTISNGGKMQMPSRIRRLAIQKSFSFSQDKFNLGCLHSLLLLCSEDMELGMINELVGRSKNLKVLELRGAPLESIPKEVFKLYYLKHLSLRNTTVKLIQKSIRYLTNLETLDLKNCCVTELPKEILELHRLRHLLVYMYKCPMDVSFDNLQSCKAPSGIGRSLSNLINK